MRPPKRVRPPPLYDIGTPVGFGMLAMHLGLLLTNLAAGKYVFVVTWSAVIAMQLATYRYKLSMFEAEA